MNLKLITLYFLIVGILISSGCTHELTASQLQSRLNQANANLNTYTIDMKMSMNTVTETPAGAMELKYDITSKGDIDRANKKMALQWNVKSFIMGMTPQMKMETYLIDGYLYTKSNDRWIKARSDDDTWTQQDKMAELVELIESGTIERQQDESFDGNSYYVLKLNPDSGKIAEYALKQQRSASSSQNIDYDNAVKSYSSTVWVNKKTFVIEKSKTEIKMSITPESSKKVDMDTVIELQISNINKEVNIVLPKEAENAEDIADIGKEPVYNFK